MSLNRWNDSIESAIKDGSVPEYYYGYPYLSGNMQNLIKTCEARKIRDKVLQCLNEKKTDCKTIKSTMSDSHFTDEQLEGLAKLHSEYVGDKNSKEFKGRHNEKSVMEQPPLQL